MISTRTPLVTEPAPVAPVIPKDRAVILQDGDDRNPQRVASDEAGQFRLSVGGATYERTGTDADGTPIYSHRT